MDEEELQNLIFGQENLAFSEQVKNKLQPFICALNDHFLSEMYEFSLTYSEFYKTFYIVLGTKYSSNDETTLLACSLNEQENAIEVVLPLIEYDEGSSILLDVNFDWNFATVLRNLLKEKVVSEKFYIYKRLYSQNQFLMTVFVYERSRYIRENKTFFLEKDVVKRLKSGEEIELHNDSLNSLDPLTEYESEVNGIIAKVHYGGEYWTAHVINIRQ